MTTGLLLLVPLVVAASVRAEVYSSVADMKGIALFTRRVSHKLSNGPFAELPFVRKMTELVECLFDVEGHAALNPISAIKMISLFTVELQDMRLLVPQLVEQLTNEAALSNVTLPEHVDLLGSVNALARLQLVYAVTVSQAAQGHFETLHRVQLAARCSDAHTLQPTASDCATIAKHIRTHQAIFGDIAKLWMYEALKLSQRHGRVPLIDAARQHATGSAEVALTLKQLVDKADADPHFEFDKAVQSLFALDDSQFSPVEILNSLPDTGEKIWNEFLRLCRESAFETYVPQEETSQLICAYAILGHAYFLIGPVKTEWVSYDPEVRIYHQVLHSSEIDTIKQMSFNALNRSQMFNITYDYEDHRVSKTAWLTLPQGSAAFDEVVKRLNHRSNLLARLNAEGTEDPQVLNYGLGGQYEPHYDYIPEPSDDYWVANFGNRIATLMYYMSDVDAGGSTVFTELGVGVHPQKGSAVFWYNVMRNGDIDYLSLHAGCPVIVGEKWAVNKWYHAWPQFDRLPCDTDPEV